MLARPNVPSALSLTPRSLLLLLVALLATATPALADDYFVDSDDYKEGEEIVGKFLGDAEYAIMIEELQRNGAELDWGWARTPGWSAPEQAAETGRRKRRSDPGTVQKPKQLGFELASRKVYVQPVDNFAGVAEAGLQDGIRDNFAAAMEALGLTVVDELASADLELGVAIVDINRESTYIYFGTIDPYITLEVRLREVGGNNLLLLRNRAHSGDPANAAVRYADLLVQFLR